jgi:hypothetical protein
MAVTAQEPITECKALLNDPQGNIYPDEKLIPLMQKAYRELQTKMMLNGLPVLKEASIPVAVAVGTTRLGDGAGLPDDFVYPIELGERTQGSTNNYGKMRETEWEADEKPHPSLVYWTWREEEIKFLGATTAREVRIRYMKGLTRIIATTSPILVNNSQTWLAARTAAIAAMLLGGNPTRAQALDGDASVAMEDLLRLLVKRQQGLPIRRLVNRYRR